MKVDVQIQQRLLDLAGVDAELSRLRHRRRNLPEDKVIAELEAERQKIKDDAVGKEMILDDLDRDIRRLEREVEQVGKRELRDNQLMQSGSLPSKQLSELEHELATLARRRSLLEDDLLEYMEQREAADENYKHAGAKLSQIDDKISDANRQRDEALADIEVAERRCNTDRNALVRLFPDEFLELYTEQLTIRGIGAGHLQGRRCGACRIELDRGELERIAATPDDGVVQCPECSAILVRNARSGL
ncbi:hypothetical protein IEU95_14225 [Hoyosella rhizosphaerae]|uniref:C4-type zinc ribbon domain-containing protein n=1 Tax=Hoyosella rhizosphaerae TaxID=1755582 RepID=A0A916UFE7_9ACTN|nr:C4-type zinc ribbon domain-containing protein [Hoyosella rhizosphaerae]MBN4927997.1 hypothetical protein [Hoyosella rhizosphaerae]GGC71577.1 hypothetical protein GCM10011410_25710 [Hoyosella rhizosphaerae]